MRGFIGNTDFDWYSFLSAQAGVDEVNFWQPSAGGFAAAAGTPFFFRLKSPHNAIAGSGYVGDYSVLPAWLAWEAFGLKNGARDFAEMRRRIEKYRARNSSGGSRDGDYQVGCIMVESPVFFARPLWVREPSGWKPNIVRGRYEDLTVGEGLRMFTECLERAEGLGATQPAGAFVAAEGGARFGAPAEIRPRLGQGTFRISVLDAYHRACAVTGEHSLPVLEAAHIRPYSDGGLHEVPNGIALRSDIHRLFDLGYVTVTPEYRFRISDSLGADFHNGRTYYALQDSDLLLPSSAGEYPHRELLDWHGQVVYRG